MAEVDAAIAAGAEVIIDAGAATLATAPATTPAATTFTALETSVLAPFIAIGAVLGLEKLWMYCWYLPQLETRGEIEREAREKLLASTPLPASPPVPPENTLIENVTKIELPPDPSSPTFQGTPGLESYAMSFPTEDAEPVLAPSNGDQENASFPPADPDQLPIIAPADGHTNTNWMQQRLAVEGNNNDGAAGKRTRVTVEAETTSDLVIIPEVLFDQITRELDQAHRFNQRWGPTPPFWCPYNAKERAKISSFFQAVKLQHQIVHRIALVGSGQNLAEILFLASEFPEARIEVVEPNQAVFLQGKLTAAVEQYPQLATIQERITFVPTTLQEYTPSEKPDLFYMAGVIVNYRKPSHPLSQMQEVLNTVSNLLREGGLFISYGMANFLPYYAEARGLRLQQWSGECI